MAEKTGFRVRTQEPKQKSSNFCKQKSSYSFSESSADKILQFQRTAGNQAVQRLIKSRVLQAKLSIGQPNDIYEHEADRVAGQVIRMSNPVIQRKPAPDTRSVRESKERLDELGKDPRKAHRAWKKLNKEDRSIILDTMAGHYGADFADQFREVAEHGKPDFSVTYWQPHTGPTPERLKAGGWRFLGMEVTGNAAFEIEVWVNPSGSTIRRDVSTYQFGQPEKGQKAPKKPPRVSKCIYPDCLDPNADRESLFGQIIAVREDVDASFGEGDVVLYENGTAELFLKGTTQSYVFRPVEGGYIVYDPDGHRLEKIWKIPKEDIPDPRKDAVE